VPGKVERVVLSGPVTRSHVGVEEALGIKLPTFLLAGIGL
jgi:hypothetical protein